MSFVALASLAVGVEARAILKEKDEGNLGELGVSEKFGRGDIKLHIRGNYNETSLEEDSDTLRRIR
jgi:hypothetical protein